MGPKYQSTQSAHSQIEWNGESTSTNIPSEIDPLNGSGSRYKANKLITTGVLFLCAVFLSTLFETTTHIVSQCPLSYGERARVREAWNEEFLAQERLRNEWRREQKVQENLRLEWALEEKHHQDDVKKRRQREEEYEESVRHEWAREIQRHLEHQEEERKQWQIEVDNHRREMEEQQREWQRQVDEHNQEMDRQRLEWWHEAEEHQRAMDKQRREWRREVEEHDRREKERREHEKQERQKMNMWWGQVEAHHCTTYATREYTAILKNLPADYPFRVEACKETPLELHGVSYLPTTCEDKGPGLVIGRWEVNQNEPDCMTFWNWYKDKGCTSVRSGKRRIEHYMENLPRGGDWREFCATTPANFLGMHFSGAQICFQENLGTYGHWEVEDPSCD